MKLPLLALSLAALALAGSISADQAAQGPPQTQQTKQIPEQGHGYINSNGAWVPSPVHADSRPADMKAKCQDGTYSFSQHHTGTCSHHGGVAEWLY